MSSICGKFSFGESRISKADIILMLEFLPKRASGKKLIWVENNLGLGQNSAIAPIQPGSDSQFHNSDNNLVIVADAFLTNREDLFQKLEIPAPEQADFSDEKLILTAYKKWGEDCSRHLLGDFAFAIRDKINKKLFCSRDQMGRCPLFYFNDGKHFIFASEPKGILAADGVEKKLNKNKLANFIHLSINNPFIHESWYEDIFPLPAGTSLIVNRDGIRSEKYWTPGIEDSLSGRSEEEILEEFRDLLFRTIGAYLRSDFPVTALLSGGLDSSGVVSVAAKILEKQNKRLDVFSSVLADENDRVFKDERPFINEFRKFPNININYISAENKGPFSDLEEFFENRDSPEISSRHYLYTEFARAADERGSKVILEGVWGELGPTNYAPGGYAELLKKLNWSRLWRELRLRKELCGESIKYNIRANVINPFIPDLLWRIKHKKLNYEILPDKDHFFQEDFAFDLLQDVSPRIKEAERTLYRDAPDHRLNQLNAIAWTQNRASVRCGKYVSRYPVELKFPFLDKRLLEFCLAVPLNLKIKDGYNRYLIRRGLDSILPPKIQWRTTKMPFSPDYLRRYISQRRKIEEFLAEIRPGDPVRKILNIELIHKWAKKDIREDERHTFGETVARDLLPKAVYLIHFLRKFSEFQR